MNSLIYTYYVCVCVCVCVDISRSRIFILFPYNPLDELFVFSCNLSSESYVFVLFSWVAHPSKAKRKKKRKKLRPPVNVPGKLYVGTSYYLARILIFNINKSYKGVKWWNPVYSSIYRLQLNCMSRFVIYTFNRTNRVSSDCRYPCCDITIMINIIMITVNIVTSYINDWFVYSRRRWRWIRMLPMMMMMFDVLRSLFGTWQAKWAEWRPKRSNEAKPRMKHPSDMDNPRFELRW